MFSSITRSAGSWLVAVGMLSQIAACGGGGSGDAPARKTMTFSPSTVTATFQRGVTSQAETVATFNTPSDFTGDTFYLTSTDKNALVSRGALIAESDIRYKLILYSNPNVAAGRYQSSFTIQICYDAACKNQFPGSPMELPYDILVTPGATASGMTQENAPAQGGAALTWQTAGRAN